MGKIFAVGDIHGCLAKLQALMAQLEIHPEDDTLVFLGDYIDRGHDSFKVIEYLIDLKKQYHNIVFLKGNHEEMFFNYLSGQDDVTFLFNGGEQTLQGYTDDEGHIAIPPGHLRFFNDLQLYYETDDYIFVHAGLRDDVPLEKQKPEDLLWIRKPFINSRYDFGKLVIFGHTPVPEALVHNNKIGIDTGAVYGYKLTCLELPARHFHTV